jgi:hypothetical protein
VRGEKSRFSDRRLEQQLGLIRLQAKTRGFPWANPWNLVRKPDAGTPPVRFDEREVETEHGMRLLRHSRGNPETDYVEAYPTAPPLDSTLSPVPFLSPVLAAKVKSANVLARIVATFFD